MAVLFTIFTGSFHMILNLMNADNDYLGDYLDDYHGDYLDNYLGDHPDDNLNDYLQPGVQRATARALLAAARHRLSVLLQVR